MNPPPPGPWSTFLPSFAYEKKHLGICYFELVLFYLAWSPVSLIFLQITRGWSSFQLCVTPVCVSAAHFTACPSAKPSPWDWELSLDLQNPQSPAPPLSTVALNPQHFTIPAYTAAKKVSTGEGLYSRLKSTCLGLERLLNRSEPWMFF